MPRSLRCYAGLRRIGHPCGGGRATDCAYRSRHAETDHRHRSRRLPRKVDSRLRQLSHFWDADGRPDRQTGIGSWTDVEIKRAIVYGKRPSHGCLSNAELAVVMATPFFEALTPSDLDAAVSHLRSVPAIRNEVAAPVYRLPQQQQPIPGAEADFADEKMSDPVYRGRYAAAGATARPTRSEARVLVNGTRWPQSSEGRVAEAAAIRR